MRNTTIAAAVAALCLGLGAHAQHGDGADHDKAATEAKRKLAEKQSHARTMLGKLAEQRTKELRQTEQRFAEAREQVMREFKGRDKEVEQRLVELKRKHHAELAAIDHHFLASRAKALKPLAGDDLRQLGQKWDHDRERLRKEMHDKIANAKAHGDATMAAKIEEAHKKHLAKLEHDFKAHKRSLLDRIEQKLTGSVTIPKRAHRAGKPGEHHDAHGKGRREHHGADHDKPHGGDHDKGRREGEGHRKEHGDGHGKEHRAP